MGLAEFIFPALLNSIVLNYACFGCKNVRAARIASVLMVLSFAAYIAFPDHIIVFQSLYASAIAVSALWVIYQIRLMRYFAITSVNDDDIN